MKHFDNRYHYVIDGTRFSYSTRVENLEPHLVDPNSNEEKQFAKDQLLERLRGERDYLLKQTDWRMTTDYPYADQAEWASYRTSLRNLPATAEPTLDEQGNLIVDWPTAPDQT